MMHFISKQKVSASNGLPQGIIKPQVIDLNNYKMIHGAIVTKVILSSWNLIIQKRFKDYSSI